MKLEIGFFGHINLSDVIQFCKHVYFQNQILMGISDHPLPPYAHATATSTKPIGS